MKGRGVRKSSSRIILLQDSAGPLLTEVVIGGRVLCLGRPGTIYSKLADFVNMAPISDTPHSEPTDDPDREKEFQRQFEEVILPWYRELTQQPGSNP